MAPDAGCANGAGDHAPARGSARACTSSIVVSAPPGPSLPPAAQRNQAALSATARASSTVQTHEFWMSPSHCWPAGNFLQCVRIPGGCTLPPGRVVLSGLVEELEDGVRRCRTVGRVGRGDQLPRVQRQPPRIHARPTVGARTRRVQQRSHAQAACSRERAGPRCPHRRACSLGFRRISVAACDPDQIEVDQRTDYNSATLEWHQRQVVRTQRLASQRQPASARWSGVSPKTAAACSR